jgi:hypothetical protein
MANRYWVGGTAAWDATAGTKWALTSGGAGGQAVPTSADDVFFDAASGASTVTIGASTAICSTLTMTGFTGTLAFGSNSIELTGIGNTTIYNGSSTLTVTGTPLILVTGVGIAGQTRSIVSNTSIEASSISFNISAGADGISTGTAQLYKNLTFSGTFTGSFNTQVRTIYGNLTFKSGMTIQASTGITTFAATSGTQQITSAGLNLDFPITFSGTATYQLQDALSVGIGTNRAVTLTSGTLNLNNNNFTIYGSFTGSGSTARTIAFGTGQFYLTALTTTIWSVSGTNLTITGTSPTINATAAATTGERTIVHVPTTVSSALAININVTAGSANFGFGSGSQLVNNLNFTGFTGTIGNAGLSAAGRFNVYGNITMGTGMTTVGAVTETAWQLLGTGTQLITSNGVAFSSPFDLSGTGSYSLQDAFVTGATRQISLVTGTLVTNGYSLTCGNFNFNNANTKTLTLTNSTVTITSGTSTTGFVGSQLGTTYNLTGLSIVFTTSGTALLNIPVATVPTVTMSGTGQLIIGQAATTPIITTLSNTVQPCTISLLSTITLLTVTNFNLSGTAGNLVTFNSSVAGTQVSVQKTSGTVNAQYMSIKDSAASGGATWNASNSVAGPNNTGWNFLASTSRLRLVSTGIMYTVTAELNEVSSPTISMSLSNFNSTEFDEVGSPGVAMRYNNGNVVQVSTEFDEVTTIS